MHLCRDAFAMPVRPFFFGRRGHGQLTAMPDYAEPSAMQGHPDAADPICSVLGQSGTNGDLTLTGIKQSLAEPIANDSNVSDAKLSGRTARRAFHA